MPRGSEAAGARREAPASPPHYSLGQAGGGTAGKWALEGRMPPSDLGDDGRESLGQLPGGAGQNCRPRSATEGPAGAGGDGGGSGGGGGRGLFLSSRDSRRFEFLCQVLEGGHLQFLVVFGSYVGF